jgi:hypothetical protein
MKLMAGMMKLFLRFGGDLKIPVPMFAPQYHKSPLLWVLCSDLKAIKGAEKKAKIKLIKFIIQQGEGTDVGFGNAAEDITSFWNCAHNGQLVLLKSLVELGADPHAKKNESVSSLHAAAENGKLSTLKTRSF